jgi:hypothetical protein
MGRVFGIDFGSPELKIWDLGKAVQVFSEKLQSDVKYAQDSLQAVFG